MNRLKSNYVCNFNPRAMDIFGFLRRKVKISPKKDRGLCATRWNLQDMKIPSKVLGCRVRGNGRARTGAGGKPGRAFFFPPLRQSHPGNLTFHTAGQSVSPRKPFPDENQSGEPSMLPDNMSACGQHQGPPAVSCAANVRRCDATSSARRA